RMVRREHRSMDNFNGRDREATVNERSTVPESRGQTLIVAMMCAVLTGACSASRVTPAASGSPMLAPPDGSGLQAVPRPDLSPMGEAVQQRIREAYDALAAAVKDRGATPEKLANAYGEVGHVLLAVGELETAEAYYMNSQKL